MTKIILASQSPRRQQLLRQIGLKDFTIMVPHADERYDAALAPGDIVRSICRKKAEAARSMAADPRALIIAADTMVFLDGLRLGKPRDPQEARDMLAALSGRTHQVCTGVALCRGDALVTEAETTAVTFRPLSECLDKAGAYGVHGMAALFVEGIAGDYFNVMGLPLHRLGRMLEEFGVDLFSSEEETA